MSKTKFGPPCTICGHPARQVIEARIIAGAPYREIAADYGINSIITLSRHINNGHMKAAVKAAEREQKKKAAEAGLNIGKCAKAIYKDSFETAKEAKGKGFYGAYGSCMKPATDVLALLSKGKDPMPIQNNITIDIKPMSIDDILAEYYGSKPDKSPDTEGNGIRQSIYPTQTDSETSRVPDEPNA